MKMVERENSWSGLKSWETTMGRRGPTSKDSDSEGKDLILDIDIQGARKVLQEMSHAVAVFILPPSPEALRERLVGRGLDPPEVIQRRLTNAKKEIEEAHRYRYVILNERLEEAVETLKAIIWPNVVEKRNSQSSK